MPSFTFAKHLRTAQRPSSRTSPSVARRDHEERSRSLLRDERGMSTLEYVILMVVIVVGAIGFWKGIGDEVKTGLEEAETDMKTLND